MNIPTFSIPAIKTCPNHTPHCKQFCYARKAERSFKYVLPSREENFKESLSDDFVEQVGKYLKRNKPKLFRLHESGDFYNQEYLDKWFIICRNNPDTRFLVYTKRWDLNWKGKPANLIRYWSIWDDTQNPPPDGPKAYVVDDGKGKISQYPVPTDACICEKEDQIVKCEKCMHCYAGVSDVIFRIH